MIRRFKEPQCSKRNCRHFIGLHDPADPSNFSKYRPRCAAFPDGIPDEIAYGDHLHLTPIEGDHGITYEEETGSFEDQDE